MDEQPAETGLGEFETGVFDPYSTLRPEQFFAAVELPDSVSAHPISGSLTRQIGPSRSADAPPLSGSATRPRRLRLGATAAPLLMDLVGTGLSVGIGLLVAAQVGIAVSPAWLAWLGAPLLVASFVVHAMYRGNGLRLIPSGLPTVTAIFRSLPVAVLGLVALLLTAGSSIAVGQVFALAALLLVPALATVPLIRSSASHLGAAIGVIRPQRVLVVGAGETADHVMQRLHRHGLITALGMVDDEPLPGFETVGALRDLPRLCEELEVDRIIVALPRVPWLTVSEVIRPLIGAVDIAIVPSNYELMSWRSGTADLAGMPMIPLAPAQHSMVARAAKRGLDITLGSLLLLACSPILLAASIAIRLDSPGSAFFRQRRAGVNGQHFSIWKFRTMVENAEAMRDGLMHRSEADGPRFKMADDPRVTRVGKFLRRYSIDELPQLFNVLGGTMSLVGPRPFPVKEFAALSQGPAAARFDMQPGMTGLWQVSGRSDLSWDDLCRLDSVYVGSWSVLWDLRILLQTPVAVLRRLGAY
jgi:exopolysaccharide biosynthesis polyprenyl glycosylphosphotransferase